MQHERRYNDTQSIKNDIQNQSALDACNYIKTVLMLFVVIYHSILFWRGTWFTEAPVYKADSLGWVALWMNSFHIYGFTLVSGYIFYHVKFHLNKYREYKAFLINKGKRLLIPYAFVAAIWIIPFQRFFTGIELGDILKNYVFGTSPSQLWFLLMLFGVFAIMWPLSDYMKRKDLLGAMVIAALYLVGIIGHHFIPNVFQIWTACMYCLFFWMGMKLCQYADSPCINRLNIIPGYLWVIIDIGLFVVIQKLPESNVFLSLLALGLNLLLNIIGSLMIYVVFTKLYRRIMPGNNKTFSLLGKYSFPIYLFHQQLIFCSIYALNGTINPYLHAVINVLVAFGGSFLISWLLAKYRITRILIGEKK